MSAGLNPSWDSWMALFSSNFTQFDGIWTQVSGSPVIKCARSGICLLLLLFSLKLFIYSLSAVRKVHAVYLWKAHISMLCWIRSVAFISLTAPARQSRQIQSAIAWLFLIWRWYLPLVRWRFRYLATGYWWEHRRGRSSKLVSWW